MESIVYSIWFALVTGLASVAGLLVTLYKLRIKYRPRSSSRLRTMEWEKISLISFGIGILIFAGIRFYTQEPPPGFSLFRGAYNFIHSTYDSHWTDGEYNFSGAIFQKLYYTIKITQIVITEDYTGVRQIYGYGI